MSDCARFERMLEAQDQEAELLAHCEGCASCRGLLELHRELEDLGEATEEPSEAVFAAMSTRVLASADRRSRERSARRAWAWSLAGALAASVLIFVAGLAFGRSVAHRGNGDAASTARRLVAAIGAEAASNRNLRDVENSRFTYSNISLRSTGPDRLLLDFDVTTHVRLEQPTGSELAREAIVQALLDRSSTGSRLQALSYAGTSLEPKVREALVLSLRSDPSLAVRLKALETLSAHLEHENVKEAVLATLREDDSVQMRLLALDALASHRVDRDVIRETIQEGARPGNEALLVRLAELSHTQ